MKIFRGAATILVIVALAGCGSSGVGPFGSGVSETSTGYNSVDGLGPSYTGCKDVPYDFYWHVGGTTSAVYPRLEVRAESQKAYAAQNGVPPQGIRTAFPDFTCWDYADVGTWMTKGYEDSEMLAPYTHLVGTSGSQKQVAPAEAHPKNPAVPDYFTPGWKVCTQSITPGADYMLGAYVILNLVGPDDPCPDSNGPPVEGYQELAR